MLFLLLPQINPSNLATYSFWQLFSELYLTGIFVWRSDGFYKVLNLRHQFVIGLETRTQHDKCLNNFP